MHTVYKSILKIEHTHMYLKSMQIVHLLWKHGVCAYITALETHIVRVGLPIVNAGSVAHMRHGGPNTLLAAGTLYSDTFHAEKCT